MVLYVWSCLEWHDLVRASSENGRRCFCIICAVNQLNHTGCFCNYLLPDVRKVFVVKRDHGKLRMMPIKVTLLRFFCYRCYREKGVR